MQKFWWWLISKKDNDKILREIDESKIKENKIIKDQAKYIQVLEARESKRDAIERAKKVEKKEVVDDVDLIKQLEKKQMIIDKERYKGAYDLFRLFKKLDKNKKFKERIEIRDKDNVKVFDIFKTILVLKDSNLAIQGRSGEIWAEGPTLRDIIHKPESIRNQIRDEKILIPYDENFNPIPDLEMIEMPEMTYDEENDEYNISEERMEPVKKLIIKRDVQIRKLREDKETKEQTIADLRNKNQDLELAKQNWKSQTENIQSDLSVALENDRLMRKKWAEMDQDLTTAQEQKELESEIVSKYKSAFATLLGELEDEKSRTKVRKAELEVWRDIKRAKKLLPKQSEDTEKKESEVIPKAKPGERL